MIRAPLLRPVGDEAVRLQAFVRAYHVLAAFYGTAGTTPLIAAFRWWMEVLAGWQALQARSSHQVSWIAADESVEESALDSQRWVATAHDEGDYLGMPALLDEVDAEAHSGSSGSWEGGREPGDCLAARDGAGAWAEAEGAELLLRPDLTQHVAAIIAGSVSAGLRRSPEGSRFQWQRPEERGITSSSGQPRYRARCVVQDMVDDAELSVISHLESCFITSWAEEAVPMMGAANDGQVEQAGEDYGSPYGEVDATWVETVTSDGRTVWAEMDAWE
jgi:hypothetical protein